MDDHVRTNKTPWTLLALVAIVLIGAVLRWVNIGREALWVDEALTFIVARHEVSRLFLEPLDPSGPVYYLAHKLFVGEVAGAVEARLVSFVAGVALIPVIFAIARRFCDLPGALFAALLVALAPALIDYSQEARAYSLLSLLFALTALALIEADRSPAKEKRRWWLAGMVAASSLALFTHLIAFPFIGLMMLWLRLAADRKGSAITLREAWTVWGIVGLLGLVEVRRLFLYASQNNQFGWLREPTAMEAMSLLGDQWVPLFGNLMVLAALVPIVVAALLVFSWRRSAPADRLFLLVLAGWLAQPLILWLVSISIQPIWMPRTVLPSWPAFALFLAFATRVLPWTLITRSFIVAVTAVGLLLTGTTREKADWFGASEALRSFEGEVLICPYWRAPPLLQALAQHRRRTWLLHNSGAPALLDARSDGDWVAEFFYNENGRKDDAARDRLDHLVLIKADCPEQEQRTLDRMIDGREPVRTVTIPGTADEADPLSGGAAEIMIKEYLPRKR